MGVKTRYLQLTPTTMMEYIIGEYKDNSASNDFYEGTLLYTDMKDGHTAILSPTSFEADASDGEYVKKPHDEIISLNTFNHFAAPIDGRGNQWFMFLDPDYKYTNDKNVNIPQLDDQKLTEYNRESRSNITFNSVQLTADDKVTYSKLRLYFTTGYDFSDMYAAIIRVFVNTNEGKKVDLCNFVYSKASAYRYVTYMTNPIVFGNFIYDRYIEIKMPSGYDLAHSSRANFDINEQSTIKVNFSYISEHDATFENSSELIPNMEGGMPELKIYKGVCCTFSRASNISGSIPPGKLTSDNLGVHIESSASKSYIEFYGTWKGEALDTRTVQLFNKDIKLYDQSLVRKGETTYEVDPGYKAEYNMGKWVAMHEITCDLIDTNENIINSETYEVSQVFIKDEKKTFYYRPVIFDDDSVRELITDGLVMRIKYVLRFMNIEDGVQFIKQGALSMYGSDLYRFCGRGTNLSFSDRLPYKVYNKIVEQKQTVSAAVSASALTTKYVKTFYDTTNVYLAQDGTPYGNGEYELVLSVAPKHYKFVFQQKDMNDNYKFMDLTDTYYKLYAKDEGNVDIVIEPTYSKNMNMVLGELEFSLNANVISKLQKVPAERRTISVVAYNADNSVSSMYDMHYTFV